MFFLFAGLHFFNGLEDSVSHKFKLLAGETIDGQGGKAVVKYLFTYGAGLSDFVLIITVGLEKVKVEERSKVRNVGNTLLSELLL